ncbi:MAG: restriction endonuclease subunit S [Coriobacteriales bacterium]
MERYEKHRDSNIEWIGEIPEEWSAVPIKNISKIVAGKTPRSDVAEYWEGDVAWITPADISQKWTAVGARNITEKGRLESGLTEVPQNSIIVSNRAPIGLVTIAANPICTNQGCKALVPHDDDSEYLYYCISCANHELEKLGKGTTFLELSAQDLGHFSVPWPNSKTRICISEYLKSKTLKIDALVEQVEKSIKLLEEYRKSIISETVTKGLNPDVSMKDSGIEWIGEIPEHWEIKKFKYIASVAANLVNPSDYPDYRQVSPERMEKETGILLECDTVLSSGVESDNHLFKTGSILYSKVRPILNKVALAPFDGLCSADIYPIVTSSCSKWLLYTMLSRPFVFQVRISTDRVKMPKVNKEELGTFLIPVPPVDEQEEIALRLDITVHGLNQVIQKKKSFVNQLHAYRKSLISEAITGKFKVPGVE